MGPTAGDDDLAAASCRVVVTESGKLGNFGEPFEVDVTAGDRRLVLDGESRTRLRLNDGSVVMLSPPPASGARLSASKMSSCSYTAARMLSG